MATLDYRRMKSQLQTGHGQDTPGIPPLVRLHLGFWYTAMNNGVSRTKRTRRDGTPRRAAWPGFDSPTIRRWRISGFAVCGNRDRGIPGIGLSPVTSTASSPGVMIELASACWSGSM